MERGQRLALILAAVVVAIVGFMVLRPGDGDDGSGAQRQTAEERSPQETEPQFETIRITGGEVQGGARRIRVEKGETARIRVRSDAPDEIHLHGYDVTKDVGPGEPARFVVDAEIEGVFEIEAHDLGHVIIGELVVEP